MSGKFVVLYTHQKTKKAKSWRDGLLEVTMDGKCAILVDEQGKKLDRLSLKSEVNIGTDLESAKYLIQVVDIAESHNVKQESKTVIPASSTSPIRKSKLGLKKFHPLSKKPVPQTSISNLATGNDGFSFLILYTHQKTKKNKMWQDGRLNISKDGRNGCLKDREDKRIGEISLTNPVVIGDELETAKYLIQIDSLVESKTKQKMNGSDSVIKLGLDQNGIRTSSVKSQYQHPRKKTFTAPRRTGPLTDLTFSREMTNPEDEFSGMSCTVVRQDAGGIWGVTHYNQSESISKLHSEPRKLPFDSNDTGPENGKRKLQSRKDILDFVQQARKKLCKSESEMKRPDITVSPPPPFPVDSILDSKNILSNKTDERGTLPFEQTDSSSPQFCFTPEFNLL